MSKDVVERFHLALALAFVLVEARAAGGGAWADAGGRDLLRRCAQAGEAGGEGGCRQKACPQIQGPAGDGWGRRV